MSPLISGRVIGAEEVVRRFAVVAPAAVRERVAVTVQTLGLTLQREVVQGLNAGTWGLRTRHGRLARSINTRFRATETEFRSSTGTRVKYGRAWELGFDLPERDIYPKNAEALFWPGASHPVKHVHQPARHQAARPWLKPPLVAMSPVIQRGIADALRGL